MTHRGSLLSQMLAIVLVLSLSLGAMPCGAGLSDDPGSPPACCLRGDMNGGGLDVEPDPDRADGQPPCHAGCAASALLQLDESPSSATLEPHFKPPDDRSAGRSVAPEPFPPKPFLFV